MLRGLLIILLTAFVSGALIHYFHRATGYREVYISTCSTEQPIRLSSLIMESRLDAFIWGYGRQPIQLKVSQGSSVMFDGVLHPSKQGALNWSYHGDWYDKLVVEIKGKTCRMHVTYRM